MKKVHSPWGREVQEGGGDREGAEHTRDIGEFLNRIPSKRKILESPEGNKDLRKKKCEKEGKQEEGQNKGRSSGRGGGRRGVAK